MTCHYLLHDSETPNSRNQRNLGSHALLILNIVIAKKSHKKLFFMSDAGIEKPPKGDCKAKETHDVTHNKLRAESPPEIAKIAGVPERTVYTGSDELVAVSLVVLNGVVKIGAALNHSGGADSLTGGDEEEADKSDERTRTKR